MLIKYFPKKIISTTLFSIITGSFFFILSILLSQNNSILTKWIVVENIPESNLKYDDIFFLNEDKGWIVGLEGNLFKTNNAGINWHVQYHDTNYSFRCITFTDSINGFIGLLKNGSIIRTSNGGFSWYNIDVKGDVPEGICGISHINRNIYACGRYFGPSYFIRSSDNGNSWISQKMDSLATSLVDCYFFSSDTGIVIGGISNSNYREANAVILKTIDGGLTWRKVYEGIRTKELCWKYFDSNGKGYVTIQSFDTTTSNITYLTTLDKGSTWNENTFLSESNSFESLSIAFIGNYGCIGGINKKNHIPEVYETYDNGITWSKSGWGHNINIFLLHNSNTLFALGKRLYKFTF